jgi:hypothetical protein
MMVPWKVNRSTIAAHRRGSVKVSVQPEKLSLEPIAMDAFSSLSVPVPGGQGVDRGRVDVRVGVEALEPFLPGKPGVLHATDRGASVPVVYLGQ